MYLELVLYALKSEQSSEMSSSISAHIARNVNVSKIGGMQYAQYVSGSAVALGHVHLIAFAGERKRPFCRPAYSLATYPHKCKNAPNFLDQKFSHAWNSQRG